MKEKDKLIGLVAIVLTIAVVVMYFVLTNAAYAVAGTEYKYIVDGVMPVINCINFVAIAIGLFTCGFFIFICIDKRLNKKIMHS